LKQAKKKQTPSQKKGSESRKATIGPRVSKRLGELRAAVASGEMTGPFSKNFVLAWIKVDKKTINHCPHHAASAKEIAAFLDEMNGPSASPARKAEPAAKKRSMREQMIALAQEAEAMRLRMQNEIDDLMDQIRPKSKARRPDPKNFRSCIRLGPSPSRTIAPPSVA
jgi:hypothetical protein